LLFGLGRDGAGVRRLLHLMEERVLYLEGGAHRLNNFTVIGATTDAGKLSDAIIDRFEIKPFFQPYSLSELAARHAIVLTNSTSVLIPFRGSSRLNLDELPQ